jgi:Lrp/AsnC family transcriptional regulator for asnA, asnC and gidA
MRLIIRNNPDYFKVEKIDLVDRKILLMLGKNARSSLREIAHFAHLSPESVKYRITQLEQKNILKGTRTIIDVKSLGYNAYHVFLKLNNPGEKEENAFVSKIVKVPQVRAVLKIYGNFDFEIALICKNTEEFDYVLTEIISDVKEHVIFKDILMISRTLVNRSLPSIFFRGIENHFSNYSGLKTIPKSSALEEGDLKLLKVIGENARLPLTEISRKMGVSHDTAGYKLKRLFPLLSFVPVIDFSSLGYNVSLLFLEVINLDSEKMSKIKHFAESNSHLLWMVKTLGKYNILAYVCTKSQQDLHSTINEFRSLFPKQIASCEVMPAVAEYKYSYIPECLFEKT